MEDLRFRKQTDDSGRVIALEVGGALILTNAQQLKKELDGIIDLLSHQLKITVAEPEEIDLSCIQLLKAFFNQMDEAKIKYRVEWLLDEEQRLLLEHVGLSDELFLNDKYV